MNYTIDPKLVIVTVGGIPITGGFPADSMIELVADANLFEEEVGAYGETSIMKLHNKNVSLKISQEQTSPFNDVFSAYATAFQVAGTVIPGATVMDMSGRTKVSAAQAAIKKLPDTKFTGNKISQYVWEIKLFDADIYLGGNAPTVSG